MLAFTVSIHARIAPHSRDRLGGIARLVDLTTPFDSAVEAQFRKNEW
jgi:hypothetical protein